MGWLDDIVRKAQDAADSAYGEQPGYQDQGDAVRHMVATGQLAQRFGRYPALGLMAAHEVLGGDYSKAGQEDSAMDLRNNRIGAEIGAGTDSFKDLYRQAVDKARSAKVEKLGLKQAMLKGDPKNMNATVLKEPPIDQKRYTSKLNTAQEQDYQLTWKPQNSPRDSGYDYDLRGAYIADKMGKLPKRDDRGHGTDTFKKPNHPTFSTGSRYHGQEGNEGGVWGKTKDGVTTFTPGATNMKYHSKKELEQYFKEVEPGAKLMWPKRAP